MRKKIIGIFICLLMIITGVLPVTGMISKKVLLFDDVFKNQTDIEFVPGEIIVKLKNGTTFSQYSLVSLNEKPQMNAIEKVFSNAEGTLLDNIYLVHVPVDSDILSIVHEYESFPEVEYAEPNWVGEFCGIPNDENFSSQWYLHNIGQVIWIQRLLGKIPLRFPLRGTHDADIDAPEAWAIETGKPDVVIAIIDTGIDFTHPDLAANIWRNTDEIADNDIDDDENGYIDDIRGWDLFYNDSNVTDGFGHGTMCAGVAGAVGNNGIGVTGVAWNCKIMPVRISTASGKTAVKYWAKALKYAADNGADICSMSFGIRRRSFILNNAIDYAYKKGVFLCAAAGNHPTENRVYPAAYNNVVAVAATNQKDDKCRWSNYGRWVDIAAPGNWIFTTMPTYYVVFNKLGLNQNYDCDKGTSFSSPIVAGVAALLLSRDPSLTPDEVKALLCNNVDPYYSHKYIGTGRVNAYKALADLTTDIKVDIRGGLRVKAVIRNEGTSDLDGVNWQIQVKGGIFGLKNKTINGTVDVPQGKSVRVHTKMLFGFGNIIINVRVGIFEETVTGKQRLIFTKIY